MRAGSTDVRTGAGARTLSVTSTNAGVPVGGVRLTDPVYVFGASPEELTETDTAAPLLVTFNHVAETVAVNAAPDTVMVCGKGAGPLCVYRKSSRPVCGTIEEGARGVLSLIFAKKRSK